MKFQNLFFTVLALALITPVTAQDLSSQKEALKMIEDFAEKICKSAPIEGQSTNVQLTGAAKAELSGLLKKVADLSVEGVGKYDSDKYQGVLQKDLATTIKDAQNCKLEIWKDLKDKLVIVEKPQPSEKLAPATPVASYTLVGTWEYDGRLFVVVADPKQNGVFELEQIMPRKEDDTMWQANLKGRDVEIDMFYVPSGSRAGHMDLKLSIDGNRMDGFDSDTLGPIRFRRKN